MKKFVIVFNFIVFAILTNPYGLNAQQFYVGTFTSEGAQGIYQCLLTPQGEVLLENTFKGLDDPSFLKLSPDKKFLYSVNRAPHPIEESGGFVNAYKIGENGKLHFLNKQVSNGEGPCHIDVSNDGKFVAIASYSSGTTSLFPVGEDGNLMPATTVIKNTGSGANENRQKEPHAHSIKFSPFNNQVLSADLGTDQVNIYRLENGRLELDEQDSVEMAPGAGPRHFDFHPGGNYIYVINELNSTVTVLEQQNGKWEHVQSVSTLPNDFTGMNYCADIHVAGNGRFLYGSNRGHNSIAVFSIEENNGKIELLKTVPVEGDWPRNFALSPKGDFLVAANQKSNNISVFRINKESGIPSFTGNQISIPAPVCIGF